MKKVRIGLVGAGNIANTHIQSYLKNPNVEIAAICDIDPVMLAETADKYGIKNRYNTLDEMLASEKELDGADVCVWNCNHAKCTIACLDAGLNVLCEKPMAYNAKEAEEMYEASVRNNKLLMIGFVTRYNPEIIVVKDFIDNGYLGDIYYAKAQYVRRHGNPGGWFGDKSRSGGGPVIDLGVHVIDRARYLMGNHKPVSVFGVTYNNIGRRDYLKTNVGWSPKNAKPEDPCDVEDYASALIRFDNGSVISLETGYDVNVREKFGLELYGTKGGMETEGVTKLFAETNGYLTNVDIDIKNLKNAKPMFDAEMDDFVNCIAEGKTSHASAKDGIVVMKILDAIYKSAATGHEVTID